MQTPSFAPEARYWQQGIKLIAGIDEVGMGALAGPVVAGAVVFRSFLPLTKGEIKPPEASLAKGGRGWEKEQGGLLIRDSKTLSPRQREKAATWIRVHALAWAVGEATVEEINTLNIRIASHLAMRRAVDTLSVQSEMLLIDGHPASPHPRVPAANLIKGDQRSFSIAAASILAKVHRDALMVKLHMAFPDYNFAGHKGYGSAQHLAALKEFGPTSHHRATYAPIARLLTKVA